MTEAYDVVVVGAGVAGAAAARAAADAGARVGVFEASSQLGGVAVRGDHRTICGLSPLDGEVPELLEPDLVGEWVERVATGDPYRSGRVWLWPCSADSWQQAIRNALDHSSITVHCGSSITNLHESEDGWQLEGDQPCSARVVIDASGGGHCARRLGLTAREERQWAAIRGIVAWRDNAEVTPARRVTALRRICAAVGERAAALTALGGDQWQLSVDVPPGSSAAAHAGVLTDACEALGAELLAQTWQVAERDDGGVDGVIDCETLFAKPERGLCWAAWPSEWHAPDGVRWRWPESDRHGVPLSAVSPRRLPKSFLLVGRGMPLTADASAALRVTGTCLAIGSAVGRLAAERCAS